jgi:UDP-N-acetylmuramoyl-L-alanyl-D-glutamate--2,6-diaminopimelate ligase
MKLGDLPAVAQFIAPMFYGLQFNRLILDSRAVQAGDVFIALQGQQSHGLKFAEKALAQGAVFILAEAAEGLPELAATIANRCVLIPQLQSKLAELALVQSNYAVQRLNVIGITGTNGKTSTTQLLAQALQSLSAKPVATIGTLGIGLLDSLTPSDRTTPDVLSVHHSFQELAAQGASRVVMEVSSHALDQGRVAGVNFTGAIYTNLTRDHLDYHGTMVAYAEAKAKLFKTPGLKYAVLNLDAELSLTQFQALYSGAEKTLSYSLRADSGADVCAIDIRAHAQGSSLLLEYAGLQLACNLPLLGRFNVSNALAVIAALIAEGYAFSELKPVLEAMRAVPGRMNQLSADHCPLVVVDYAHTPDALEQTLSSLRAHVPAGAALHCVFGCGGDRDVGKRPLMGEIAARLADQVLITTDNPRTESPAAIIAAIAQGVKTLRSDFAQMLDRKVAIESRIAEAGAQDVILIAGKGHEDYQDVAGVKHPFDDRLIARSALNQRSQGHNRAA